MSKKEKRTEKIKVYLSEKELKMLDELAKKNRTFKSTYIRNLIEDEYEKIKIEGKEN